MKLATTWHAGIAEVPPRNQACPAPKVKVRGQCAYHIPGDAMKIVAATWIEKGPNITLFFEALDSGLPAGLLASPSLVRVVRGTAYIPVVNVGTYHAGQDWEAVKERINQRKEFASVS